jgi:ubiquinol-cytochrome c reductase cytochrome c subunit
MALTGVAAAQAKSIAKPQAVAEQKNAGAAQAGKKLYEHVGCYECHGHEGQGGAAGKRIAPRPIPYTDFASYCRRPTAEMPPYSSKILSDADLTTIYSYLQSLPDPPSAKSISILNEAARKAGR